MSIRTILAPGVQINEIDKSQYSPSMTGSNCFVMGLTDRGEPYSPMEFTSRAAWQSFYGSPTNEAERYAYAAATEVLNQNGRLYFARLPYDNPSIDKVVGFKYSLRTERTISANLDADGVPKTKCEHIDGHDISCQDATPFWEVNKADPTIDNVTSIEPAQGATLFELSTIDAYRTDEMRVPNNSFIIADIAFNTYGKVMEDTRKGAKREMIGIMPVVTTAANAMYQQRLIDVARENVIGYETIGTIQTLDAASQIAEDYPALSTLTSNKVKDKDLARLVNTKKYYKNVVTIDIRRSATIPVEDVDASDDDITKQIRRQLKDNDKYVKDSWDGQWQRLESRDENGDLDGLSVMISFKQAYSRADILDDDELKQDYKTSYAPKFGWHNPGGDDTIPFTVSQEANTFFPTIDFDGTAFDRTNLKKIGVVVYKMFMDPSEGNKINFEPVEAFAGSLCKTDRDANTGATTFIDTIINSQSRYINFFSNCFNTSADRKYYAERLDMLVMQPGAAHQKEIEVDIKLVGQFKTVIKAIADAAGLEIADLESVKSIKLYTDDLQEYLIQAKDYDTNTLAECRDALKYLAGLVGKDMVADTVCPSLGFYSDMTKKTISIAKTIYDGMTRCFEKVEDVNKLDIDVIPDAGLANIASYLKAIYGDKGEYDLMVTDDVGNSLLGMWRCDSNNQAIKTWKTVQQKLDNFCKNVRKDCMFIADGPRPFVLQGQKKIIRETKPTNTIDANIIPNIKWITGLNTSYGACYVDWFEQADDYSGDFFWCPPSIKAMGVYINCDVNFNYWDAPAGLNRGVIAATDVAFSPTIKQAGSFYEKNLNYAIQYPNEGIVLEGQKTLQTKPSAFDRVNVRRLFLRLERAVYKTARWFVYEGNTAYTRQRLVDALDPYFKDAKNRGGIYEYKIKCDESNNTSVTIDNNELHVAIGIKPVKTAEFIMVDFTCLRTGGSWAEAGF